MFLNCLYCSQNEHGLAVLNFLSPSSSTIWGSATRRVLLGLPPAPSLPLSQTWSLQGPRLSFLHAPSLAAFYTSANHPKPLGPLPSQQADDSCSIFLWPPLAPGTAPRPTQPTQPGAAAILGSSRSSACVAPHLQRPATYPNDLGESFPSPEVLTYKSPTSAPAGRSHPSFGLSQHLGPSATEPLLLWPTISHKYSWAQECIWPMSCPSGTDPVWDSGQQTVRTQWGLL